MQTNIDKFEKVWTKLIQTISGKIGQFQTNLIKFRQNLNAFGPFSTSLNNLGQFQTNFDKFELKFGQVYTSLDNLEQVLISFENTK